MNLSVFIKKSRSILIISILVSLLSCKKDEISTPDQDTVIELSPVEVRGNINLPVNLDNFGNLKIVSGYYEGEISLSENTGGLKAEWRMSLNEGAVQLIVLLNNDLPLAYAVSVPNDPSTLDITPVSTTEAIILMHPFFINNDPNEYKSVLNLLKSVPSFNNLNSEISTAMSAGYINFNAITSLGDYFSGAIDNLFETIENQQIGLEITNVDVTGNPSFQLINRRKRWINVVAEKVKNNNRTPVKIIDGGRTLDEYLLPSDEISLLRANIYLEEISPVLVINDSENADFISVRCYGPGINGFPNDFNEYKKGVSSLVSTFLFDYLIPVLEIKSGIQKGKLKQELRGRPNNNPLVKLIERLENEFKNPETFLALSEAALANRPISFFSICFDKGFSVIDNPANAKLIYDLLKEFVPKENLILIIGNVLPAIRIISLSVNLLNLQSAVYALFVSDWETEFIINLNNTNDGEFKIFSNTYGVRMISVSKDGSKVFASSIVELYKWNPDQDVFAPMNFLQYYSAVHQSLPVVEGMAINPIDDKLYVAVRSGLIGQTTILKNNGGGIRIFLCI